VGASFPSLPKGGLPLSGKNTEAPPREVPFLLVNDHSDLGRESFSVSPLCDAPRPRTQPQKTIPDGPVDGSPPFGHVNFYAKEVFRITPFS